MIFRSPNEKQTIEQELAGEPVPLSQFGQALEELGVTHIKALTPQAKGRIERLFQTLQDRWIVELRLRGIDTIEEANTVLPELIKAHNEQFAVEPRDPESAFVPLEQGQALDLILCYREKRTSGNRRNNCLQRKNLHNRSLGSPTNHPAQNPCRSARNIRRKTICPAHNKGKLIQLITNDWGRSAEEIGELYRKRWQIRTVFSSGQNSTFRSKRSYGQKSERAVYNQIWIALITYCLLRLLQQRTKSPHTLFRLLRRVRDTLFKPLLDLIQLLHRKPTRTSRGRRRVDPEEEFRQFVKQLEEEGMESIEGLYADVMEVI